MRRYSIGDMLKIIQIIPTLDWYAEYAEDEAEAGGLFSPLVAWALVEAADGGRSVVGVDLDPAGLNTVLCPARPNFRGYFYAGDATEETGGWA
jgi:hypothetical protein